MAIRGIDPFQAKIAIEKTLKQIEGAKEAYNGYDFRRGKDGLFTGAEWERSAVEAPDSAMSLQNREDVGCRIILGRQGMRTHRHGKVLRSESDQ